MALNDLVGTNIHNQQFIDPGVGQFNPPSQLMGIGNHQYIPADSNQGGLPMGQHPLMGMPPAVTDANIGNLTSPGPGYGNFIGIQPPTLGIAQPDYSSQFENFGKQLGGFGEQLTGYQDALGGFNEQIGGMGKQFETISNRLDSVDKGLGSLGNQIASLENMQKAQPQQVMQPQRPMFNPFSSPFGFGGLGSLFGRRY